MNHAEDDPAKPIHGVFRGDRDEILRWIDLAFQKAARGSPDVRRREENRRSSLTVRMDEQIGWVGGRRGSELGQPPCFYLRLILEDDGVSVVTAYPTSSF